MSISIQKQLLFLGLLSISVFVSLTAWVLLAHMPESFLLLGAKHQTKVSLIVVFALVWFLGALALLIHYVLISRPLQTLSEGATRLASGDFGYEIPTQKAGREIDQVVDAFNYMSKELQNYDRHNIDTLMNERNKFISEKNKLESVLMSIADGVVVCDHDNKVQIVNAAATRLFEKDVSDLVGKPLIFCTEGPDSPQVCRIIQDFTDTITPTKMCAQEQQIHLGERIIRLNIAPLLLESEFLGSVMIMQDITQQTELERMKNEFISNVSHELRTPITSIKSYVDTLCNHGEKLEPEIYREFLDIIHSEADRLMYLVNEVLELSRIEEGDREFERVPQNIREIIEYAVKSVNLTARDKGIEIFVIGEIQLPMVEINREAIERSVINLLTNAIKYTPTQGKIEVGAFYDKPTNEVRIDVIDNGIGIPEDSLNHIFDRFYRVERKVHTIKGTGLGLTIVKKIIEKHGGRITAKSLLGKGSTFSIYLPISSTKNVIEKYKCILQ